MIGWLYRMIFGSFKNAPEPIVCEHQWETMHINDLTYWTTYDGFKQGQCVTLRCKKCGDWTTKNLLP